MDWYEKNKKEYDKILEAERIKKEKEISKKKKILNSLKTIKRYQGEIENFIDELNRLAMILKKTENISLNIKTNIPKALNILYYNDEHETLDKLPKELYISIETSKRGYKYKEVRLIFKNEKFVLLEMLIYREKSYYTTEKVYLNEWEYTENGFKQKYTYDNKYDHSYTYVNCKNSYSVNYDWLDDKLAKEIVGWVASKQKHIDIKGYPLKVKIDYDIASWTKNFFSSENIGTILMFIGIFGFFIGIFGMIGSRTWNFWKYFWITAKVILIITLIIYLIYLLIEYSDKNSECK